MIYDGFAYPPSQSLRYFKMSMMSNARMDEDAVAASTNRCMARSRRSARDGESNKLE